MNRHIVSALALGAIAVAFPFSGTLHAQAAPDVTRYTVAPDGNEARYRVREQLARMNFPNDAVGKTSRVEGGIAINGSGEIIESESRFSIDMASLATDRERRDNYVRRNTLQTEQYPTAEFVPTAFRNLRFPLPASGDVTFQMVGNLTLRGVTRPVTWDVTAKVANGAISGEAATRFTFADFEIPKPRVGSVLSVEDEIKLEYTFNLVRQQ